MELSLGFWFSNRIRSALAVWDWATVLQGVHQETGATQGAIAKQTDLSQASISRLMAGSSKGRDIETAVKLLDGLGAPRQLAGLTPRGFAHLTQGTASSSPPELAGDGSVKRRDFTQRILLAGLAIPLAGAIPGNAGPVDVVEGLDRPSDAVADLWALDAIHGGAGLADLAETRLNSIEQQLKRVSLRSADEPVVQAAIGHIATAAAWFSYEGGDLRRAERLLKEALYAAHQSGDTTLKLHVINNLCLTANASGDPAKMALLARDAIDWAPRADPQLRALLEMRVSLGHAGTGDAAEFARHRGAAWDLLGKSNGLQDEWFRFFGEQEIRGLDALGRGALGSHAEAAQELAVVTTAMAPRNRAYYQVIQAAAEARSGEVTTAITTFHESLPTLLEITSHRISDKIADFAEALRGKSGDDVHEARRIALSLTGRGQHDGQRH